MTTIRWRGAPAASVALSGIGGRRRPGDVEAWLDTIHRLAQSRAKERQGLADTGETTRARLRVEE